MLEPFASTTGSFATCAVPRSISRLDHLLEHDGPPRDRPIQCRSGRRRRPLNQPGQQRRFGERQIRRVFEKYPRAAASAP